MRWRKALYLGTTPGLQPGLWLLIRHGTCCIIETISGARVRHKDTPYYSLYLTKPSALGQHLFATHTHGRTHTHAYTHALCPCPSPSHTRARARSRSSTERALKDWHVARDELSVALSVNSSAYINLYTHICTHLSIYIYFFNCANNTHILTLIKRRSAAVLPCNKEERRNHELPINILQQNVSKGTQRASLATLITPEHGFVSRPASHGKHFF